MKYLIILSLLFCLAAKHSRAQDIPDCIKRLNKKTQLTTTGFERAIPLKGNRTVYEFSVKSVRQCIDCENGSVFYDANCNVVAYFIMGRGSNKFVADGYTAAELGKAGYTNINHGPKQEPVPYCIEKLLAKSDSLHKAGVSKIIQVRMKGKLLYGFEHKTDPKKINCKDCSKPLVYYNADCRPEVTFRTGGIAGVQGEKGYTATDYINKSTLRILWNASK